MQYLIRRNVPGTGTTTAMALVVAAALAAGCGGDDAPIADPDVTNVEPREAMRRSGDAPDVDAGPADDYEPEPAIDTKDPDDPLPPTDQDLYALAAIAPASDSGVAGSLRFHETGGTVDIEGELIGLDPGTHGLHIHVAGDCSAPDATSAEGHFAPEDDPHGGPGDSPAGHHVGDLGSITANEDGVAGVDKSDAEMTLKTGDKTILDRAVIVHAEADDLASQPSGDAGDRVGCGVVKRNVSPAY